MSHLRSAEGPHPATANYARLASRLMIRHPPAHARPLSVSSKLKRLFTSLFILSTILLLVYLPSLYMRHVKQWTGQRSPLDSQKEAKLASHTSRVTQAWCKANFASFWDKETWPPSSQKEAKLALHQACVTRETFTMKEGIQFRIRIHFMIQREIVTGLKYIQKTSRLGVTVDKMSHMVGSYAPKSELQSYTTPVEDAPAGMTGRGTYHVHSLFSDDDKKEYLKWDWNIEIKKDW
eukprot:snap_masked-scaffold1588_size34843-processed-gene-0.5 protein:Tk02928 transcript:snap_masked-scaffold1588_size34843-processed-gene-0.5-mRNA-1 annotation:"unknown"